MQISPTAAARFDHLVIAARSLDEGSEWVAARLGGIRPRPGGAHPRMATHNHFVRLSETTFLEVIAIDPSAPPPARPRWFGLDSPALQARLAVRPRLVGWVAAVTGIHDAIASCPIHVGPAERMSRGALEWLITIPADGSLVEGGTMAALIQWPADRPHPATGMPDLGCALISLDLRHPEPERLTTALDAIGFQHEGSVRLMRSALSLSATIRTPTGMSVFES